MLRQNAGQYRCQSHDSRVPGTLSASIQCTGSGRFSGQAGPGAAERSIQRLRGENKFRPSNMLAGRKNSGWRLREQNSGARDLVG